MKILNILKQHISLPLFLLLIFFSSFSKVKTDTVPQKGLNYDSCNNTNSNINFDYISRYKKIEAYIPNEHTSIKHIRIAVNIFTGPGTIQNTVSSVNAVNQMIFYLNDFYSKLVSATYPIVGVTVPLDTKIRFDLDGRIFFYAGTSLYNSSSIPMLEEYVQGIDSNRMNNLNIYITDGGKASPYAIPPYPQFIIKDVSTNIASSLYGNQGVYLSSLAPNYVNAQTLAHEIGHCLDLFHAYNPSCCHETCDDTDPEYLYDLFGLDPPDYCWEIGGFGCKITPRKNTCTNNIMGGNNMLNYYFSPMQIGKMHRALSIKSVRRYVKDSVYNSMPIKIKRNETWNFDIRCYSNIVIESGTDLTVTGKILMADQAEIIVKRGASLILDGGIITGAGKTFQGIKVIGKGNRLQRLFGESGKVIYKNGAVIENNRK